MVHDYAKSAQRHREKLARENKKSPAPIGLFLITLIAVSAFAGFLYYLTQVQPELESPAQPTASSKKVTSPKKSAAREQQDDRNDGFDFYTLLPESEVIAPDVEEYNYKDKSDTLGKTAYLLQAGSFRNGSDADRLRAKLILDGLDVNVSRVRGKNGDYWHRVLVGPFTSRSRLNHAQDVLARANTQTLVLKVKP